jgi:hypothetical protein
VGEKGNMSPYLKPSSIQPAQTTQLIDGNRYQLFCDFLSILSSQLESEGVDWLLLFYVQTLS